MTPKNMGLVLALTLLLTITAQAQTRLTGTILGRVTDPDGLPVPGATVTVLGAALIGTETAVTSERGQYRVVNLPPGTYTLTVELPGFRTVRTEGIVVSVGTDVEINVKLEPATLEESMTVVAETPVVDVQQVKNTQTITKDVLNTVPLARSIISAIQLAPGVVERTVAGSARNDSAYLVDGSNVNAPDQGYVEANLVWDSIEEVEFVTTASSAENYGVIGGAINVVTKSGGNQFKGTGQYYFTNEDLAQQLVPAEIRATLRIGAPSVPLYDRDGSVTLGGPVKRDRTWFFGSYRYVGQEILGSFQPAVLLGKDYDNYNAPYTQNWGFGKVTTQLAESLRAFVSYNYTKGDRPHDFSVPARRTLEATRHWQAREHTISSNLTWVASNKTYIDARFGAWIFDYDGLAQPGTENNPAYTDRFSGYTFGRLALPDATVKRNYSGSVKLTRYIDDRAGSHELKAGFETQYGYGAFIFYSPNSLSWDTYNNNIYYYRGLFDLTGPHPTFGDGRLGFTTASTSKGDSLRDGNTLRYGGFVQDIWRLTSRLTLNLGLRYDLTRSHVPQTTKKASDVLAQAIGEAVFVPTWGVNPYGVLQYDEWNNPLPWKGFAPQAGLVFDLRGDGKTALKAKFARYQERMPTWHFSGASPSSPRTFLFNWWDENRNGRPDPPGVDRYAQADASSPLALVSTDWRESIDPDIKTPYVDEVTASVEHQLARNLRLSVGYSYRTRKNMISNPLYDLKTRTYWNRADSGFWVPFRTTVPAFANFPAQDVTLYFQKTNAPASFTRLTNIPEASAVYNALDITLNRRLADGWQLGGSVVFSKLSGTYPLNIGNAYGFFQTPNFLVNRDGRLPFDRPVQVKTWGSFTLPYQVVGSFFYSYLSGSPWARTVSVIPPAEWAAANGTHTFAETVLLEPLGTRRNPVSQNFDARVEKVFRLLNGHQVGVFMDAFNVFGFTTLNVLTDPAGTWRPTDVNVTTGTFSPASTGLTGISGVRVLRFSVRYAF